MLLCLTLTVLKSNVSTVKNLYIQKEFLSLCLPLGAIRDFLECKSITFLLWRLNFAVDF